MTGADLIEKLRRYPIPTVSIAVLIVCLFILYLRIDLISDLDARHSEVLKQRDQMQSNNVAGKDLAEHLETMAAQYATLESRVVQQKDLGDNKGYFYLLEKSVGITIGNLEQRAGSEVPAPKNSLGGVGYDVTLSGTFAQIVSAFDELENGNRFYRFKDFVLERGRDDNKTIIQLSLNLELLGWQPK